MSEAPRRAFLRQLCTLPLIGGSVSLIGQPTAVAEPVTMDLLEAYKTWLHYERRSVAWEMAELPEIIGYYGGTRVERFKFMDAMSLHVGVGDAAKFHHFDGSSPASHRAALVLSTVGCDWHDDEARYAKRRA